MKQFEISKTEMIEAINKMTNEQQNHFYNHLREGGMSEDDIRTIQAAAFFTKLYSNPELYRAIRDEMGRQLYAEFTR
jgi:hypothetical protein